MSLDVINALGMERSCEGCQHGHAEWRELQRFSIDMFYNRASTEPVKAHHASPRITKSACKVLAVYNLNNEATAAYPS